MKPKIQIKQIPLLKIKESKDNERNITQRAVNATKKSIQAYGYNVPLIINTKNEIIAGHVRFRALKELGYEDVTCVVTSETDPDRVAKMRLLDNAISEVSSWDSKKFETELRGIYDISELDGWDDFKEMFPDTSELEKALQHSVGFDVKDVTNKEIEKEESRKGTGYKKSTNQNEREVTCPNCERKFKARVYDN